MAAAKIDEKPRFEDVGVPGRAGGPPPRAAADPRDPRGQRDGGAPSGPGPKRNADFPWDSFDSDAYLQHNYRDLRGDDRKILELVRDFFGSRSPARPARPVRALDVGTGPNLYPALAMMPFCATVSMVEMSARNVAWLNREVKAYSPSWDVFWSTLRGHPRYREVPNPREALAAVARVRQGSIFDLPTRRYDLGTMFFVAESISAHPAEFDRALEGFVGALRPGALFAAAFMEHSVGYDVGHDWFPAVSVNEGDITAILKGRSLELDVHRFEVDEDLLREGYTGMILVCGRAR